MKKLSLLAFSVCFYFTSNAIRFDLRNTPIPSEKLIRKAIPHHDVLDEDDRSDLEIKFKEGDTTWKVTFPEDNIQEWRTTATPDLSMLINESKYREKEEEPRIRIRTLVRFGIF